MHRNEGRRRKDQWSEHRKGGRLRRFGVTHRTRILQVLYEPPEELRSLDVATLESLGAALKELPAPRGVAWPTTAT